MKPKLGIFAFGGCLGCQHELLNREQVALELLDRFDIVHFPLIDEKKNDQGPFDVVLVEGAINTKQALKKLMELRASSRLLVALGTCACFGGIPSMKNFLNKKDVELVYGKGYNNKDAIHPSSADAHVKVDFAVKGCPVDAGNLYSIIKQLLLGKMPSVYDAPVCIECRANENACFLQKGRDCIGPLTCGGCNAVCINSGIACFGCRGPTEKPETKAFFSLLAAKGYSDDDIKKKLEMFAGLSKRWKK